MQVQNSLRRRVFVALLAGAFVSAVGLLWHFSNSASSTVDPSEMICSIDSRGVAGRGDRDKGFHFMHKASK
jgi:hypothetical protein